eukprot:GFKZ01006653.1.p1 GENE.GFKZ01006653.1~~GFKZ01006653.1.p1  ORF type:complete len:477 (+),score=58.52 GFKZ01006653.1:965-2395(+)
MAGRGGGRKKGGRCKASSASNAVQNAPSPTSKEECLGEIGPSKCEDMKGDNCLLAKAEGLSSTPRDQGQASGVQDGIEPQFAEEGKARGKEVRVIQTQPDQEIHALKWQLWTGKRLQNDRMREKTHSGPSAIQMHQHCVNFSVCRSNNQAAGAEVAARHHRGMPAVSQGTDEESRRVQAATLVEETRILAVQLKGKSTSGLSGRERAESSRVERDREIAQIAAQKQQQHDQRNVPHGSTPNGCLQSHQAMQNGGETIGVEEFFERRRSVQNGTMHGIFGPLDNTEKVVTSAECGRAGEIPVGGVFADNQIHIDDSSLPTLTGAQLVYETGRPTEGSRNVDASEPLEALGTDSHPRTTSDGVGWMTNARQRDHMHPPISSSAPHEMALQHQQQGPYLHQQAAFHGEMKLDGAVLRFASVRQEQEFSGTTLVQPSGGPSMHHGRRIQLNDVKKASNEEIRANTLHLTVMLCQQVINAV